MRQWNSFALCVCYPPPLSLSVARTQVLGQGIGEGRVQQANASGSCYSKVDELSQTLTSSPEKDIRPSNSASPARTTVLTSYLQEIVSTALRFARFCSCAIRMEWCAEEGYFCSFEFVPRSIIRNFSTAIKILSVAILYLVYFNHCSLMLSFSSYIPCLLRLPHLLSEHPGRLSDSAAYFFISYFYDIIKRGRALIEASYHGDPMVVHRNKRLAIFPKIFVQRINIWSRQLQSNTRDIGSTWTQTKVTCRRPRGLTFLGRNENRLSEHKAQLEADQIQR